MATTAPSTLGAALLRAIVRAIVATLAIGAGLTLTTPSDLVDVTRPPGAEAEAATAAPTEAERVLAAAEAAGLTCWTGAAPAEHVDDIPGSVVWAHPDGRLVVSTRLVGPALESVFNGGTLEGHPVAWCAAEATATAA